eukprot:PhF_6_TR32170/c0_g2_i2/m.47740
METVVVPPRKVCLVILDGVGDLNRYNPSDLVAVKSSSSTASPLSAAHIPALNSIAGSGLCGLMDPVTPGLACGSDTAHLNLLGYPPKKYYTGRGALETLGTGLDVGIGDICFKSNFATMATDGTRTVVQRRCDRRFEVEGPILCDALNAIGSIPGFPQYSIHVKYATEHRCGIAIRGPDLSDAITGTDPLRDGRALVECTGHELTSKVVMAAHEAIHQCLKAHPINVQRAQEGKAVANIVLFRGAGQRRADIPPFQIFPGFMIAPTCIIAGLGKLIGLDVIPAAGATGDYHSNYASKAKVFVESLPKYEFGLLHVKGIDDAGHDGEVKLKQTLIEKADKDIISYLIANLPKGTILAVTGDHTTPCSLKDHSTDPVPFVVTLVGESHVLEKYGGEGAIQKDLTFDEISCARGCLGRFGGESLIPMFLKLREMR